MPTLRLVNKTGRTVVRPYLYLCHGFSKGQNLAEFTRQRGNEKCREGEDKANGEVRQTD